MRTVPLSEAKAKLSEIVDDVSARDERVVITRNGRPAAVVVSPDDLESWQETIEIMSDPELMADLRKGIADVEAGRVKTFESTAELRKYFGIEAKPRSRTRRQRG